MKILLDQPLMGQIEKKKKEVKNVITKTTFSIINKYISDI